MTTDNLLSRLDNVRKSGKDSHTARCPAHADRTNSLVVTDRDGTTLVHCFAGCSANEIAQAVGLEISDLFPPRDSTGKPCKAPFPALAALRAVAFEGLVILTAGKAMASGKTLLETDRERVLLAVERIQAALSAVSPSIKGGRRYA